MNNLTLFFNSIRDNFWFVIGIIEMLVVTAFIERIVFLEYQTVKQIKVNLMLCMLCTVGIFTTMGLLGLPFVSSEFGIVALVIFIIIPFIYSGVGARKRRKWLGFFEWIPLLGYLDGILILADAITGSISDVNLQQKIQVLALFVIIVILCFLLVKQPTKFIQHLILDVQNRSLSVGEELVVWVLGLWLFVYTIGIKDYIAANSTKFVVVYVSILNFVFAIGIVLFVINSNYREYYFKKINHLQKTLISTMAELVEERDENTGGHIQRTSYYVELIAKELQKEDKYKKILTDEYIEDMVIAAPLHDVGKIHIPDAILNKPGKLDEAEFSTMKTHAAAGGKIITSIEVNAGDIEYLKIAKEMAEYHHERMDGKGYPHGISGDEIPLCARILAVADVFDAVSSKRVYKEAMPLDKSFEIIREGIGTHFDEAVANAFLRCQEQVEAFCQE